jgi:Tfp pilus assembly protein PilN
VDVDAEQIGLTGEQAEAASYRWSTAVGLALWDTDGGVAPSLLPSEVGRANRQRQMAFASVGALVVVLVGLGGLSGHRLLQGSRLQSAIAADNAQSASLQGRVKSLQGAVTEQKLVADRRNMAVADMSGDIDWVRLLQRISTDAPPGVTVTDIQLAKAGATTGAATSPSTGDDAGSVSLTATTKGGAPAVAKLIANLSKEHWIDAFWVSDATTGLDGSTTVSGSAVITSSALSSRASSLPGGKP